MSGRELAILEGSQVSHLNQAGAAHSLIAAVGPVLSDLLVSPRGQNSGFSGEIAQFLSVGSILKKILC